MRRVVRVLFLLGGVGLLVLAGFMIANKEETGTTQDRGDDTSPPLPKGMLVNRDEITLHPDIVTMAEDLHAESSEPVLDLETIQEILTVFRKANGSNPFGSENEEIVAGLIGNNPKRIALIDPDHESINEKGQLLDRWGTPYFFHPLTKDRMEVKSAGPDRKLFTDDDIELDDSSEP